jgi:general secretion pathway protein A
MYNDYFGFNDAPFSIAPNPQYLYMSERHREALAHLLYGINTDGGFVLLTGEVGTGKTTVCRCLLEQIPAQVDTAFVLNPKLTADELLASICDELGIDHADNAGTAVLVDKLNEFLLSAHQQDRRTVVIIDEAQNLDIEVLEQLRLLTNLETNQRKLLQIILLGQPELLDLLAKPELRQLSQRITARFHLDALHKDEVSAYISHRLQVAGGRGQLFNPAAINRIFRISGGIPRLINLICDRALLGTYVENRLQVDKRTVNNAAREILGDLPRRSGVTWPVGIAAVLLASLGFIGWTQYSTPYRDPFSNQGTPVEYASAVKTPEPAVNAQPNTPAITRQAESFTATDPPGISRINRAVTKADPVAVIETERLQPTAPPTEIVSSDQVVIAAGMLMPAPDPITSIRGASSIKSAYRELFELWDMPLIEPEDNVCTQVSRFDLQCLTMIGSLRDISHLNRPAIINLEIAGTDQYVVVTGVNDGLVGISNDLNVKAEDLLRLWDGRFTLLWRRPPGYVRPLSRGDSGSVVEWLESQLALINNNAVTGADGIFGPILEQAVKQFQLAVGLKPDGIVGAQTWVHINSRTNANVPALVRTEKTRSMPEPSVGGR